MGVVDQPTSSKAQEIETKWSCPIRRMGWRSCQIRRMGLQEGNLGLEMGVFPDNTHVKQGEWNKVQILKSRLPETKQEVQNKALRCNRKLPSNNSKGFGISGGLF